MRTLGAASVALLLIHAAPAFAAGIVVDRFDDSLLEDGGCSLREAALAASTNTAVDTCPAGDADAQDLILLPSLADIDVASDIAFVDVDISGADARGNRWLLAPGANVTLEGEVSMDEVQVNGGDGIESSGNITLSTVFVSDGTTGLVVRSGSLIAQDFAAFSTVTPGPALTASPGTSVEIVGGGFFSSGPVAIVAERALLRLDKARFQLAQDAIVATESEVRVTRATMNGGSGAFIRVTDSYLEMENVTLADNAGDGVVAEDSFVDIVYTTIVNNGGTALEADALSNLAFKTSIIMNNGADCVGNFFSVGGNLFSPGGGCEDELNGSDEVRDDPGLGPLQDNGGAVNTMALLPGGAARLHSKSICFDLQGRPVDTDARGFPRLERCSLGAFDVGPTLANVIESPNECDGQGGVLVDTGADLNADGQLAPTEVEDSVLVCEAADGANGVGEPGPPGEGGAPCRVEQGDGAATITCPDGSSAVVSDGCACSLSSARPVSALGLILLAFRLGRRARALRVPH